MLLHLSKAIYIIIGALCVVLAVIGVMLPLLPTTPFLLLAAFCFSKGSRNLHSWLLASPLLGKVIEDWEEYGTISLKTKLLATVMIVSTMSYALMFVIQQDIVKAVTAFVMLLVIAFIWSRPNKPIC